MTLLLRTTLIALVALVCASVSADAQYVPGESDYKLAPAITGARSRVFVGTQRGTILIGTSSSAGVAVTDSLTRTGTTGGQAVLPAELQGIWHLSMPNITTHPDFIVGLVSYDDGGTSRYGALRSTDFGASWSLVKDAALADARFTPTNRFWDTTGLRELTWLADAQNGWAFGTGGIVATSDGGATWTVRMTRDVAARNNVEALAFRDPMNGVAVLGWTPTERFNITTDGGATWALRGSSLGLNRVNQIDWIANQYRAIGFDRSALSDRGKATTYFYRSTDMGQEWESKAKGTIVVEQSYHTEIDWLNARTGFMMMKSGEVAVTQDAGTTWTRILEADSVGYPMPIGTNRGFGYATIILDGRYLVQAATIRTDGELDTLVQFDVSAASVEIERGVRSASVAPTPATGAVRIPLAAATAPGARYSVVDAAGVVVMSDLLATGTAAVAFDVSSLAAGVYRVAIDDRGERTVAPLVVVH